MDIQNLINLIKSDGSIPEHCKSDKIKYLQSILDSSEPDADTNFNLIEWLIEYRSFIAMAILIFCIWLLV